MIELREVTKTFAGPWYRGGATVKALDGVDLSVPEGTALGIVGLNGAGKSTLLRVLLGYARPTAGTVTIGGMPAREFVERNGVAYIPENLTIPRRWTVREALRAYAMLANLGDDAWTRVDAAIERLGLASVASRRISTLSKGNVQRVGVAQALLGDRRVMVLDEPTDGLDPVWMVELRGIVDEWRRALPGRVVILASHNLAEVQRLVERIVLLHNGRIREDIPIADAKPDLERHFLARVRDFEEGRP
jgi:ABC-type multidrug transport system ATPase subunit